jgi:hypothetical protein
VATRLERVHEEMKKEAQGSKEGCSTLVVCMSKVIDILSTD